MTDDMRERRLRMQLNDLGKLLNERVLGEVRARAGMIPHSRRDWIVYTIRNRIEFELECENGLYAQ